MVFSLNKSRKLELVNFNYRCTFNYQRTSPKKIQIRRNSVQLQQKDQCQRYGEILSTEKQELQELLETAQKICQHRKEKHEDLLFNSMEK